MEFHWIITWQHNGAVWTKHGVITAAEGQSRYSLAEMLFREQLPTEAVVLFVSIEPNAIPIPA